MPVCQLCGDEVTELYSCEVCKKQFCADDEGCIQYQRDRFTCLLCECGRVQSDEAGHWIGTDGVCLECKKPGKRGECGWYCRTEGCSNNFDQVRSA